MFSVRLACVKRAASVRPEPGSNSLFKLYIQTLRVFISILAITIRSQLPLWFFCLFWLLKVPISWNLKGFLLVVHCSIFKILSKQLSCCNFILYHLQKFLSSKHFVNRSSTCFLSVPSRRDQLFYFITFCRFCQVNILWTEVHSTFSFSFLNSLSKTVSLFILPHFKLFVKWTFLEQLQPLTVDLPIRFTVSLVLYSLNFCSRATALLLYHTSSAVSSREL